MKKNKTLILLLTFSLINLIFINLSWSCRIIPIPPRPFIIPIKKIKPIQVKFHKVNIIIKDNIAITTLETVFFNPNYRDLEGTYIFPLPKNSNISNFSMWIDGKEVKAELLDASKAKNLYLNIVKKMLDPGLLEFIGRRTFKLRIYPIPSHGTKKIKLTYTQIIIPHNNILNYIYPLTTVGNGRDDILERVEFQISINSSIPIKNVFSPTHKIKIEERKDKEYKISFVGENIHPDKDFVLYITRSSKKIDISFLAYKQDKDKEGYFLLIITPTLKISRKEALPKDIVFVFDTSGSMAGEKIEQAKNSLIYCLNSLNPFDRFNIILFSTLSRVFSDKLINATHENIKKALDFIESEVEASGGTNIEEALTNALKMNPGNFNRPYMVLFLTDGIPTIGICDINEILKSVEKYKKPNIRIFTFGVGYDVNTKLLDRLSEDNNGAREYVKPNESIEIKISNLMEKISFPILSNININFISNKVKILETYPRKFPDLFKNSSITILGKYKGNGEVIIKLEGNFKKEKKELNFKANFPIKDNENIYIPRLWAVRKVGYLLDQIRLHGENKELKEEVIKLAKKYGIVTPYTSYLVMEDKVLSPRPLRKRFYGFSKNIAPKRYIKRYKSRRIKGLKYNSLVGSNAVKMSQTLKKMKEAQNLEGGSDKNIKKIGNKTFYLENGIWIDSEYSINKNSYKKIIEIKYLSKEYFKLLSSYPEISKYLSIGKKIILVYKNKVYKIR